MRRCVRSHRCKRIYLCAPALVLRAERTFKGNPWEMPIMCEFTAVFRYLLMVWNSSDAQQCTVATDLKRSAIDSLHTAMARGCGVILGHLFRRPCDESPCEAPGNLTPA